MALGTWDPLDVRSPINEPLFVLGSHAQKVPLGGDHVINKVQGGQMELLLATSGTLVPQRTPLLRDIDPCLNRIETTINN